MRTMYVPFIDLRPDFELFAKLDDVYLSVIDSGTYIRGRFVVEFEEAWASYVGTEYCVGVGSGTEALHLLLRRYSKETIHVPRNSKPTLDALLKFGYTIKLEDVGEDFLLHSSSGRVSVPVHLYGNPVDMNNFTDGVVIEDACQAHGSVWNGRKCGSVGIAAAWSFYPTKNLGAYGDAGAITTNNESIAEEVRLLGRMDPLQAAFLTVKLPYLDSWNSVRKEIAYTYLEKLHGVRKPPIFPGSNWHLFVIRHHDRSKLQARLIKEGVETVVHYLGDSEVLSLPCNPWMTTKQVEHVIRSVNKCAS